MPPTGGASNIHPDERQQIIENRKKIFTEGYDLQEYRFRHKDGHYIWQRDEATLFSDNHGEPLEIIGTWINVTDRKQADEQVRTQLHRVETLNAIQVAMVSSFDVRLILNSVVDAAISRIRLWMLPQYYCLIHFPICWNLQPERVSYLNV